jgi:hypothetical protein
MIFQASPLLVLLSSLIFGLGITLGWPNHILLAFFYTFFISILTVQYIYTINKYSEFTGLWLILILVVCNHVGIFLGYSLASGADYMLWPADAIDHHLPNAIAVSKWILGEDTIEIFSDNPFSKIYISNIWVGIFFAIFGIFPIVSGLAMLIIKLCTIYLIYRSALILTKTKFIALTAAIIYGLLPTLTFYTIQFYKDFFIQFLIAVIIFIQLKSIKQPKFALLIPLPLAILFVERFYLLVIICITLVLYYWSQSGRIIPKILIFLLGGYVSYFVLNYYFPEQNISQLMEIIKNFEIAQNDSTDVTPTTNIVLDLFRIIFTPFFNFYKVDQYKYFDSLLTFGGFIHQLIIIFYLRGLWVYRDNRFVLLNFGFLFLLIILAMIMPYDGRARDSFYPLVSIFTAIGINSLLKSKISN